MSSSKRNLNKEIIGLFSGQANQVTIPKLYIEITGSYNKANILNQCLYWSTRSECKDGWFYKKYSEWFEETHLSESTVRRTLTYLEEQGWITTKVKKIGGLNIKHVLPDMDKVIDSIKNLLDSNCPNRSECQDGAENEQNPCTNIAPTGQVDRSEPVNVTGSSIYTDDYNQIKLTNCDSSSSFYFSETTDRNLINQKLSRDLRTEQEFMIECVVHVDNYSDKKYPRLQRANALVKLLKQLKESNVIFRETKNIEEKQKKMIANETDEQRNERQFFTYELIKEHENPEYVSEHLKKFPQMRDKYARYAH